MTEKIGLIVAMGMEARPILRRVSQWKSFVISGFRAYGFTLSGADCILVESGVGADKAAAATKALVSAVSPHLLVSFGIAGTVETDLQIGDVVICERVVPFSGGALGDGSALAALSDRAYGAAARTLDLKGARLYSGTAITTSGPQPPASLLEGLPRPVLEMETVGMARSALEHETPLLSIRSISDNPKEPIPFALEDFIDENGSLRLARVLGECIRHPSLLSRLLRVGRNGAKAAENAAAVIAAILEDTRNVLQD